MKLRFLIQLLCVSVSLSTADSLATTIAWGNAILSSSFNSDGSNLEQGSDTAPVSLQIGIFISDDGVSEFNPSFENRDQWSDRFVSLSADGTPNPTEFDSSTGRIFEEVTFGSQSTHDQVSNVVAPVGFQVYIWGYQDQEVDLSTQTDWLLITGSDGSSNVTDTNWIVPDVSDNDQTNLNLVWDINNSNVVVVGRTNDGVGSGGSFGATPLLGLDDIQFAQIPEPSVISIIGVFLVTIYFRRRRRCGTLS